MNFRKQLLWARREAGITQPELVEELGKGWSLSIIVAIESGRVRLARETYDEIIAAIRRIEEKRVAA